MKKIEAIIKPFKLEAVQKALAEIGITGFTVFEVKGFSRPSGEAGLYRNAQYVVGFLPKVKIEIALADAMVPKATAAILEAAKTGRIGDGKIFVSEMDAAVSIRTRKPLESEPDRRPPPWLRNFVRPPHAAR